jgi:hypothetical protein
MTPVVTETGSTTGLVKVITHFPTPALPGQVHTVDGTIEPMNSAQPSSQRTWRALPRGRESNYRKPRSVL